MSLLDDDLSLLPEIATIATRAANEGIPVAAIARVVQQPFEQVSTHLKHALSCGSIGSMPKPDWPPAAKWDNRTPSIPRSAHPEDVEFQCKKVFKCTKLEAAFMMVLLRHECVEKEKLHGVIEEQRAKRPLRPDKLESTDPKMVDVIVCKLRKKLSLIDPAFKLVTSWGSGYYFEAPVKEAIFARLGDPYASRPAPQRSVYSELAPRCGDAQDAG